MDFKTATLIAIFGCSILILVNLAFALNSFADPWEMAYGIKSNVVDIMSLIGQSFLLVFFISLYNKQK